MAVVYIDVVFAANALTDGFLLLVTARLAGLPVRRKRCLVAALAGGAYAAAGYLPGWAFLTALPVRCAAGVGLALLAFGEEARLGRLTALFFAVSCGFAGCVLATAPLAGGASGILPGLWAAVPLWAALAYSLRQGARRHAEGTLLAVRVRLHGGSQTLTALWDSGNGLRENGRPVLVVSPGTLDGLFPAELRPLLAPECLRAPADLLETLMRAAPELRPRLLPYHAVGVEAGLLLTVESEGVEAGGVRYPGLRLALSPTELGDGYSALWGGERGESHERLERKRKKTEMAMGAAPVAVAGGVEAVAPGEAVKT